MKNEKWDGERGGGGRGREGGGANGREVRRDIGGGEKKRRETDIRRRGNTGSTKKEEKAQKMDRRSRKMLTKALADRAKRATQTDGTRRAMKTVS